jgi:hypothetical protein
LRATDTNQAGDGTRPYLMKHGVLLPGGVERRRRSTSRPRFSESSDVEHGVC